jgi:hypothetical protein
MKYKQDAWDYALIGVTVGMLALGTLAYYKSSRIELKGNPCHESFHFYSSTKEADLNKSP